MAETSGPGQQGTHVGLYTLGYAICDLYEIRTVGCVRPGAGGHACKSAARGALTLEAGWTDGCRATVGMGTGAEAAVTRQAAYVMLAPVTSCTGLCKSLEPATTKDQSYRAPSIRRALASQRGLGDNAQRMLMLSLSDSCTVILPRNDGIESWATKTSIVHQMCTTACWSRAAATSDI